MLIIRNPLASTRKAMNSPASQKRPSPSLGPAQATNTSKDSHSDLCCGSAGKDLVSMKNIPEINPNHAPGPPLINPASTCLQVQE